jgi:ABC-type protease/lipase transport system fused ATPase/permease subunit
MQCSNLDASWDKVVEAAKQVKIHDTNNASFHNGCRTIVGEQRLQLLGEKSKEVALAVPAAPLQRADKAISAGQSK